MQVLNPSPPRDCEGSRAYARRTLEDMQDLNMVQTVHPGDISKHYDCEIPALSQHCVPVFSLTAGPCKAPHAHFHAITAPITPFCPRDPTHGMPRGPVAPPAALSMALLLLQ